VEGRVQQTDSHGGTPSSPVQRLEIVPLHREQLRQGRLAVFPGAARIISCMIVCGPRRRTCAPCGRARSLGTEVAGDPRVPLRVGVARNLEPAARRPPGHENRERADSTLARSGSLPQDHLAGGAVQLMKSPSRRPCRPQETVRVSSTSIVYAPATHVFPIWRANDRALERHPPLRGRTPGQRPSRGCRRTRLLPDQDHVFPAWGATPPPCRVEDHHTGRGAGGGRLCDDVGPGLRVDHAGAGLVVSGGARGAGAPPPS